MHSSRLSHTSSYLLVHQDGRHAQKYYRVMQTYIIFNHVMKTLCNTVDFTSLRTCVPVVVPVLILGHVSKGTATGACAQHAQARLTMHCVLPVPVLQKLQCTRKQLGSWGAGELESWRAGELESRRAGELESWGAGELESWRAGILQPVTHI